jgi:hypothetical protein
MRVFVMLMLALMLVLNVPFAATASQEEDAAYSKPDYERELQEEVQPWASEEERAEYEAEEREEGYEAAAEEEEQDTMLEDREEQ